MNRWDPKAAVPAERAKRLSLLAGGRWDAVGGGQVFTPSQPRPALLAGAASNGRGLVSGSGEAAEDQVSETDMDPRARKMEVAASESHQLPGTRS